MLILAGVAINMTIGDNGIFKKAADTVVIHENAEVYEQLSLKITDDELGSIKDDTTLNRLNKLKSDGYIDENNIVNVIALTKKSMKTGKGSVETGGDFYGIAPIENDSEEYYLFYIADINQEPKNLGKLFNNVIIKGGVITEKEYFEFNPETGGIALKNIGSYYSDRNSLMSELGLKTIVIPSTYEGQTVTKIGIDYPVGGSSLFTAGLGINANDAEEIIIPSTVTEIGERAFFQCRNLKTIKIPDGVTEIGYEAFYNCRSLKEITIPASVMEMHRSIFTDCYSLEKIYVPFKEGEQPSGWKNDWNDSKAQIIYKE